MCALGLASCSQPAAPLAGDGELVLELGGASGLLSDALVRLGVELLPAPELPPRAHDAPHEPQVARQDPPAEPPPLGGEDADDRPSDGDDPKNMPGSAPGAEPAAYFVVELGKNETLMDLASRHLGTARRFREIMECNGMDDRAARRLKVGAKIKIPTAAAGPKQK